MYKKYILYVRYVGCSSSLSRPPSLSPPPKLSRLWAPILGNPHKPIPWFLKHQHLFQHSVIWRSLDRSSTHCRSYVPLESFSVASQVVSRLLVQRIRGVGFQEQKLHFFVSILNHICFPLPPIRKAEEHVRCHTCNPTMTAFRFNTGFQSSRRMLRQTLPSRSILG